MGHSDERLKGAKRTYFLDKQARSDMNKVYTCVRLDTHDTDKKLRQRQILAVGKKEEMYIHSKSERNNHVIQDM